MIDFTVILFTATILPILCFFHEPSMITKTSPTLLQQDAYFGYSMGFTEKTLIIAAPAADQFGEIFEFNLAENIPAKKIFSPLKNENSSEYDWLGASIKSYAPGSFVICAPRQIQPGVKLNKITRGRCYKLTLRNREWVELADIGDESRGYFNDGMDTFGWTVDVDDNRHIWIASPVIQNSSIKIYDDTTLKREPRPLPTFRLNNGSDLINFGYSIVSGNFLSATGSDHAVSYTYGDDRHGKVFIFEKRAKKVELLGDEDSVGSAFGAALCRARLGHARASLLVGAPTFATPPHAHDRGAVYLYVPDDGDSTKSFTLKRVIRGQKDAGYFGQAIVSIGDMDGDQKDEVAIGAPFEGEGEGAVYIYSGAALLSGRTWAQRIRREARSFGFSLLPLPDYSENGLSGLAVGAPLKNSVYVIASIPSITVNVDAILPNSQYRRKDIKYVDFAIVVDVIYPALPKDIDAKLEVKLEIEHPDATLEHATSNGTVQTIIYNLSLNTTVRSYKKTPRILTPIGGNYDVAISYTISVKLLVEPEKDSKLNKGRVLLSERSDVAKRGVLWVSDCKAQEHCVPDLSAELRTGINDPYTVGSSDKEYLTLFIHNNGETAYSPCAVVDVRGVRVLRPPQGCVLATGLECRRTHPLRRNADWEISNIELEMDCLTSRKDNINSINILYDIYNDCNNKSDHKLSYKKSIALRYEDGIHLMGISIPSEPVEITKSDLRNVARLQHQYTIMNNGAVNWDGVTCDILLQNKNYLQYPKNVTMRRGSNMIACSIEEEKPSTDKDAFTAVCNIGDLHKFNIIEVLIDVEVIPDLLRNALQHEKVIVLSQLTLKLSKEKSISKTTTTTLVLHTISVPVWVIVISVLFGILILLLIAFILYKYNCFERKNKKKLDDLKTQNSIRSRDEIADGDGNYKTLLEDDIVVVDHSVDNSVAPIGLHSVDQSVEPSRRYSVDKIVAPSEHHNVDQTVAPSEDHSVKHIVEQSVAPSKDQRILHVVDAEINN